MIVSATIALIAGDWRNILFLLIRCMFGYGFLVFLVGCNIGVPNFRGVGHLQHQNFGLRLVCLTGVKLPYMASGTSFRLD